MGRAPVGPRAADRKRASPAQGPHRGRSPASTKAHGGCRTSPHRCRRGCVGDVAGKRVADLCAAPGGKTAQLVLAGASVVAVDSSKTRLGLLAENLARLGLAGRTRAGRRRQLAARREVRCGAARRPLLVDRHHPPASRHPLYQVAERHRGARRPPGEAARQCRQAGQAGRQARLFDLLARARGGRGANRGAAGAKRGFAASIPSARPSFSAKTRGSSLRAVSGPFPTN